MTVSQDIEKTCPRNTYLLTPDFLVPAVGTPVADPRSSVALRGVEVRVLPNHLELLQREPKQQPAIRVMAAANAKRENGADVAVANQSLQSPEAHLVDEVHGGREEDDDPAGRLPGAHAAYVVAREQDGDHGLPGARVEHRDGVPLQRRLEHLHLVPAPMHTRNGTPPSALRMQASEGCGEGNGSRSRPPRLELPVGAARRRWRRRRGDGAVVVGHGAGFGAGEWARRGWGKRISLGQPCI